MRSRIRDRDIAARADDLSRSVRDSVRALRTVAHNSQRNSAPFVHHTLLLMMAGLDPAAMEVARRSAR
jgi:hypothetical protein